MSLILISRRMLRETRIYYTRVARSTRREGHCANCSRGNESSLERSYYLAFSMNASNKFILQIISSFFLLFATSEVVGAFINGSSSRFGSLLLFNAVAKFIVVISMQLSSFGEFIREKSSYLETQSQLITQIRIPGLLLLLLVAGMTLPVIFSCQVLLTPSHYETYKITDLNGYFTLNVLLNVICYVCLWTKGRQLFFETPHDEITRVNRAFNVDDEEFGRLDDQLDVDFTLISQTDLGSDDVLTFRVHDYLFPVFVRIPSHSGHLRKNLTMVASISHLSVDAVRAMTCLFSGIISLLFGLNAFVIYSWACVSTFAICSFIVILPLAREIFTQSKEVYGSHTFYSKVTADDVDDALVY